MSKDSAGEDSRSKYKIGFSERFRMVTWDNAISLDDTLNAGQAFTRHRTSVTGQYFPIKHLELAVKMTNEFRYYFMPSDREFTFHEIVFDWFYLNWRNTRGLPFTLTVGRQNIILGEGFLVLEAHPFDGSRAISFNAARLDLDFIRNHRLTMFYTKQPRIDDYLPIIHDQEMVLIEQPEEGIGFYYEGRFGRDNLQAYYIRKNVMNVDYMRQDPAVQEIHMVPAVHPASHINTIGFRFLCVFSKYADGRIEVAYQFGDKGIFRESDIVSSSGEIEDVDRSAVGGYMQLGYSPRWPVYAFSELFGGVVYLSGDTPGGDYSGWDPVFGRWPKWSESYIYTQIPEDGVAFWTNLIAPYGRMLFNITRDRSLRFNLDYYKLFAAERHTPASGRYGGGRNRGDLVIGKLKFRINQYLTGHLLWEGFWPGNYYKTGSDGYSWARIEFLFKI